MARAWWATPSNVPLSFIGCCWDCFRSDMHTRILTVLLLFSLVAGPATAARLKDLVAIEGVRDNQLIGYGLVVGLAGTGDRRQTMFTAQSLANMLNRMGISVPSTAI